MALRQLALGHTDLYELMFGRSVGQHATLDQLTIAPPKRGLSTSSDSELALQRLRKLTAG
jgi:hypothetical protein